MLNLATKERKDHKGLKGYFFPSLRSFVANWWEAVFEKIGCGLLALSRECRWRFGNLL